MQNRITEIQIVPIKPTNGLVGFASLVLDNSLYLGSIGIFTRPGGGCRLTYPTRPGSGSRLNIFHPINKSLAEEIEQAVSKKLEEILVR